jgi:hypothetical protein
MPEFVAAELVAEAASEIPSPQEDVAPAEGVPPPPADDAAPPGEEEGTP